MKNFLCIAAITLSSFAGASDCDSKFSKDRLIHFQNEFFLKEKQILSDKNLSSKAFRTQPDPLKPPSNPPAPTFKQGYLPLVLVNNSTLPDEDVYVLITGKTVDSSSQVWGQVNTTLGAGFGNVSLANVSNTDNSSTFSVPLSSLPRGSTGRVVYLPQIRSGIIWFSMSKPLNMGVNNLSIVQPNFTNSQDPNYATNFDIFELTYLAAGSPQIAADATAVSFFSIPLYGYLAGATSASSNTGLYQPRSYIMGQLATKFNQAVEHPEWSKLILKQGDSIIRCLSTGKSISASGFDANYLNNSSYGYDFIDELWTKVGSYYKNNNLTMSVTTTAPAGTFTYTGSVQGDNTFKFTSLDSGNPGEVTFLTPTTTPTPTGTTTYNIFSALNLTNPTNPPTAGTAADAISKLFEEALIAGLLPTTNTLSLSYLSQNQSNFYQVNPNLSTAGQTTGPWYDLYSKVLHGLGSIYTFGFDEPLWPQVLLEAPFVENSTYLGITIGSVK